MNKLKLAIVSCGFLGCSPFAPGTVGTLGGIVLALLLIPTGNFALWAPVAAVAVYVVGRSLGDWSEQYAGKKDPGIFVLDEVIGYLVTVWWLAPPSWLSLTLAFFVFRFFDIFKPPPARKLESLGGGDGILLDDVIAGLYGLGVMALARLLLPDLPWDYAPSAG